MYSEIRKVDRMELFFDLVFVYAVSQCSHRLFHISGNSIPVIVFFQYIVTFFLFITVWTTETLFLNRYHIKEKFNYTILLFQMLLLMYLANLASQDWNHIFTSYSTVFIILQTSNILQYALAYRVISDDAEKRNIVDRKSVV